jgi:L-cysteine:1D-myo-inositol 2-amino-2-deoxy-alpha-D-glucopyranoside ligase
VKSWNRPEVPGLPGSGEAPRIWDTASRSQVEARPHDVAALYVCGITPYDATHLGHAATYLAYDLLVRQWLDAGYDVRYVQNVTDIDDPLLERATAINVDWRELAASQIELFRNDMQLLGVIPPDFYVAVTEVIDEVADAVTTLLDRGLAYRVGDDIYFDSAAAEAASPWKLGDESHLERAQMLVLSAERGGDPEREGKRDALDPLLWRGECNGDPAWQEPIGSGRPGWHIECSVIAQMFLDIPVTVKGGGSDLIFPHHEFSAGHTAALSGTPLAELYSHTGMVAYRGSKMSKSLGNLVLVSQLVEWGADPQAIRLALLGHHYRSNWEWHDEELAAATVQLAAWQGWAADAVPGESLLLARLRGVLANDLDAPGAVRVVDAAISAGEQATAGDVLAIQSLLGISLVSA